MKLFMQMLMDLLYSIIIIHILEVVNFINDYNFQFINIMLVTLKIKVMFMS